MTNPVKIPGKVCGKKDLWGPPRMALGGITLAFLGEPQKPHGISEVLRSFDSQSQHALVSSAARVIYCIRSCQAADSRIVQT